MINGDKILGYSLYATNKFCSTCALPRELGIIRCPECGRKVQTHRMSSKKKSSYNAEVSSV